MPDSIIYYQPWDEEIEKHRDYPIWVGPSEHAETIKAYLLAHNKLSVNQEHQLRIGDDVYIFKDRLEIYDQIKDDLTLASIREDKEWVQRFVNRPYPTPCPFHEEKAYMAATRAETETARLVATKRNRARSKDRASGKKKITKTQSAKAIELAPLPSSTEWMNKKEAALQIGVGQTKFDELRKTDGFPKDSRTGRKLMWAKHELDTWMQKNK